MHRLLAILLAHLHRKCVWFGSRIKVSKGVTIDDYNTVAQDSVVVRSIHGHNQVFAGFPIKLIHEGDRRIQD